MWVSKKEFDKLKERVEILEQEAECCKEDDTENENICCGKPMIETTVFGTNGRQYTCIKCGMQRDTGVEYR